MSRLTKLHLIFFNVGDSSSSSIKLLIALGLCPRAEKGRREGEREGKTKITLAVNSLLFPTTTLQSERRRSSHGKKVLIFIFQVRESA